MRPYFGIYTGKVVDNDDPDKSNRLQIRIPSIHGTNAIISNITKKPSGISDDDLPWANVLNTWGVQSKPYEIGDLVYVSFELGNVDLPIVLGTITKYSSQAVIPDESLGDYVNTKSMKMDGFTFLTNPDKVKIHKDDFSCEFNVNEKKVKLEIGGNTIEIDGNAGLVKLQGETQKAVLGDLLKTAFDAHTHMGNLGAPTSPPLSPLPPTTLSEKVKLS